MTRPARTQPRTRAARRIVAALLPLALVALAGCPPKPPAQPVTPPPLPSLAEAVATVNDNVAGITETLAASSPDVDAVFHDEEGRHTASFIGTLRFLPPRHLFLKLSLVAEPSAIELGSNDTLFWVAVKLNRKQLWYGRWAELDPADNYQMPLSPDMILAATGLAPLPGPAEGLRGPVPRVDDDRYYKLQYMAESGNDLWIQREYWLDRFPPHLPRVVRFLMPDGTERMRSTLDRYERVGDSDVHVARRLRLEWSEGDSLAFRLERVSFNPRIRADSPAYEIRSSIPRSRWTAVTEPRPATMPAAAPAATQPAPAATEPGAAEQRDSASSPAAPTQPALEPESSPE